jgi:archaellin
MYQTTRGQSGLDRLLLFVVAAIVLVAALPTALSVVGIDVRSQSADTETTTPTAEPEQLQVLDAVGTTGPDNRTVDAVRVTVVKVGGDSVVDTAGLSAVWTNGGNYSLVPVGGDQTSADGAFGVAVSQIGNRSGDTLTETGDRATLTFDLGTDTVEDIPEFGSSLGPGDEIDLVVTTAAGGAATISMRVPAALDGTPPVDL